MEIRQLGKTDFEVPIYSLGGEGIIKVEDEDSLDYIYSLINRAIDLGIRYIDTAPAYGDGRSEERIGTAIQGRRDEIYLATKCDKRDYDSAKKQIEESLSRLKVDHVDCIQIHHLDHQHELRKILRPDGALKALIEAKDEGLTKYIGVTGHSSPDLLVEALNSYDFDTVLTAINAADKWVDPMVTKLLPVAAEKNVGVIGMKVAALGILFRKGGIESMDQAIRYVLSSPVHTIIVGLQNIEQLERNIDIAENFKPMDKYEVSDTERLVRPYADAAMFFRHKSPLDWDDVDPRTRPEFVV